MPIYVELYLSRLPGIRILACRFSIIPTVSNLANYTGMSKACQLPTVFGWWSVSTERDWFTTRQLRQLAVSLIPLPARTSAFPVSSEINIRKDICWKDNEKLEKKLAHQQAWWILEHKWGTVQDRILGKARRQTRELPRTD
jgi:hypothetical protein